MTTKAQDEEWLNKMLSSDWEEQRETFKRCTNVKSEVSKLSHNEGYKKQVQRLQKNKKANHGNF